MWPGRALSGAPKSQYEKSFESWCGSLGFRFIRTQSAINLIQRSRTRKPDLKQLFKTWRRAQFYLPTSPPLDWDLRQLDSFGKYYLSADEQTDTIVLWQRIRADLKHLFRPWHTCQEQVFKQSQAYEMEWVEAKAQWRSLPLSCRLTLQRISALVPKQRKRREIEYARLQLQSFPDYFVFFKKGCSSLVEIKGPGGQLKPHQRSFYPRLEARGFKVLVARPSEVMEGWKFRSVTGDLLNLDFVPNCEFELDE